MSVGCVDKEKSIEGGQTLQSRLMTRKSSNDDNDRLREEFIMHKYVFNNDYTSLESLLESPPGEWKVDIKDKLAFKDKHGNTPLHLAISLGRKECIKLLLSYNAPVKVKNNEGWNPLAEAISYGDRKIILAVLRKLKQQSKEQMEGRRSKLVKALKQMQDFYMELKWDFTSWVPLVTRILPSDLCRIYKSGACLRLDTTLVDFNDLKWERGDISFVFQGDKPKNESLTILDNEEECYQHVRYEDSDIEDEVDVLMSTDIIAAQMSTKSIQFTRAKSGWLFREDRKENVNGQYACEVFDIQGLVLKQRKRREHLSLSDLQKNRAMVDLISRGNNGSNSFTSTSKSTSTPSEAACRHSCLSDSVSYLSKTNETNGCLNPELLRRGSLEPPPKPNVTWEQYINAEVGKCPLLGRSPINKETSKSLRATVAMSKDFPLSVDMLLDVLEIIAPFKHIKKLREFVNLKLPPGFPVKIEIPVLHTVTAKITFQKFEFRDNIPKCLFQVPSHYIEESRHFSDL